MPCSFSCGGWGPPQKDVARKVVTVSTPCPGESLKGHQNIHLPQAPGQPFMSLSPSHLEVSGIEPGSMALNPPRATSGHS